jgi:hypothetical protein
MLRFAAARCGAAPARTLGLLAAILVATTELERSDAVPQSA